MYYSCTFVLQLLHEPLIYITTYETATSFFFLCILPRGLPAEIV